MRDAKDYAPGDLVCWDLGGGVTHIGIVVAQKNRDRTRYKVIHNIGAGQTTDDIFVRFSDNRALPLRQITWTPTYYTRSD
ncbi:MAG: DUF1287 domain-containing protein [Rikenellaceae bacterium]|nr:DUF1287 domain-containing protein [Rikenellaceae bacterium]